MIPAINSTRQRTISAIQERFLRNQLLDSLALLSCESGVTLNSVLDDLVGQGLRELVVGNRNS